MTRTFLLTLITISLSSCQDESHLGNSYYYLDSFEAIDVGFPDGAIIYKGDKELHFDTTIISKEVIMVTHNDKFIFAKQLATSDIHDTNYYYIDKYSEVVYGPLTLDSSKKISALLNTGL
jgi:hypothetical protein